MSDIAGDIPDPNGFKVAFPGEFCHGCCYPVSMREKRNTVFRAHLPVNMAMEEAVRVNIPDNGGTGTKRWLPVTL